MKLFKKQNIVLMMLALLFIAPGLSAYIFYLHPQWLGAQAINKGVLLKPVVLIPAMKTEKKWSLVLWSPQACKKVCQQQLDQLGRIRLALGRRLYEVNQCLVTDGRQSPSRRLMLALHEHAIDWLPLSKEQINKLASMTTNPRIFIADPDGYLILAYASTAKPGDIFHDLKHLLNSPGSKSG